MKIGLIGLGKMGGNMALRLTQNGVDVVGHDRNQALSVELARADNFTSASSLAELVESLPGPRVVWLMLPAGGVTEGALTELKSLLAQGDVVVDGANSNYKDSMRRDRELAQVGIRFADVGVSGGVWGLANGYCLMAGGEAETVKTITPVLEALAPAKDRGWLHCGRAGSGHFTKMIHNGIEYGMMQALAEGLALLNGREDFNLDLGAITEVWRHGSVVRSWLLDLTSEFLAEDACLDSIQPVVADSGEGRWTLEESIEQGVPAPVIGLALMMRFQSQGRGDYANKLLAKMRHAFGGHHVGKQS